MSCRELSRAPGLPSVGRAAAGPCVPVCESAEISAAVAAVGAPGVPEPWTLGVRSHEHSGIGEGPLP